jgi:hypothetical protein
MVRAAFAGVLVLTFLSVDVQARNEMLGGGGMPPITSFPGQGYGPSSPTGLPLGLWPELRRKIICAESWDRNAVWSADRAVQFRNARRRLAPPSRSGFTSAPFRGIIGHARRDPPPRS